MKSKRAIGEFILSGAVATATGIAAGMYFNDAIAPTAQAYGLGAIVGLVVGTVLVGITVAFFMFYQMLRLLPQADKYLKELERQRKERKTSK